MALGVREASEAYERSMRNMAPPGPGVCPVCRGFIDEEYETCFNCGFQPRCLDAVVPITYSEHLGQMHTALRNYKEGAMRRDYEPVKDSGTTCGDLLDELPDAFSWSTCAVHGISKSSIG